MESIFDPYDEAEILANHLATIRAYGEAESCEALSVEAGLGQLILSGQLTEDELSTIILNVTT